MKKFELTLHKSDTSKVIKKDRRILIHLKSFVDDTFS